MQGIPGTVGQQSVVSCRRRKVVVCSTHIIILGVRQPMACGMRGEGGEKVSALGNSSQQQSTMRQEGISASSTLFGYNSIVILLYYVPGIWYRSCVRLG